MRSFVTIISMILLFTASASGQEAGDRARGLFRVEVQSQLDSIRNVVGSDQLIRRHWGPEGFVGIEGVITPMMDLETEDGTIIAKAVLIDPEYYGQGWGEDGNPLKKNPAMGLGLLVLPGVAYKLFEVMVGVTTCATLGTLLPGDTEWNECTGGTSWGKSMGLGALGGGLVLTVAILGEGSSWQPW